MQLNKGVVTYIANCSANDTVMVDRHDLGQSGSTMQELRRKIRIIDIAVVNGA